MLYASLKAAHLLSIIVWVGGMFFTLACLRPAVALLEPEARVAVMRAALRRFLGVAGVAVVLVLASGSAMIAMARAAALRTAPAFNMPLDWYVMSASFVVMLAIFVHIRLRLFRRLEEAAEAGRRPEAAAVLGRIRLEVLVNLVLGVFIVVVVALGQSA